MSRLDHAAEIIELAGALGVEGPGPVEGILDHCRRRIDGWVAEAGGVAGIDALEALVTGRLQMVFEEIRADEDFDRLTEVYARGKREFVFAGMRPSFDDAASPVYGLLVQRRNAGADAPDRYVAVVDCRGGKLARRFFTRWHEIAHRLTTQGDLLEPVLRSEHDPIERLMDEIAAHVGFYSPIFDPALRQAGEGERLLRFGTVEGVIARAFPAASFQATLFACIRRTTTPVVYLEAELKYKVGEERRLRSRQQTLFEDDPPVAKLRVGLTVPNQSAIDRGFRIMPNMRVPEGSVIHDLHADTTAEQASSEEDLGTWEFSDGNSLPDCEVWVEARKAGDRIIAIVQPTNRE